MKSVHIISILASALIASTAFAGNHQPEPPKTPTQNQGQNQGQSQGQAQGQAQGQGQSQAAVGVGVGIGVGGDASNTNTVSNTNTSTSTSTGGESNAVGISGGSFGGQGGSVSEGAVQNDVSQSQSNDANNSNTNEASGNNTNVTVGGDTYNARRIPVSTAYAAGLTSGFDTCLGSASGGVQLPGIGVSLGKTTLDKGCKLIKETHLLREFGTSEFERAACHRMRAGKEGADIDAAMKAAGIDCKAITLAEPKTSGDVVALAPVASSEVTTIREVPVKKIGE